MEAVIYIYMELGSVIKEAFNSSKMIVERSCRNDVWRGCCHYDTEQLIGLPLGHQAPEILSEPVPTDLGRKANG